MREFSKVVGRARMKDEQRAEFYSVRSGSGWR